MIDLLLVYTALVTGLVWAEMIEARRVQYILKPAAALWFCFMAVWLGAFTQDHNYGRLIFAGLAACAIGDVCLLARGKKRLFQLGMLAFAAGHLIYAYAFFSLGQNAVVALIALLLFGTVSLLAFRHMSKTLDPDMRASVLIYNLIITGMVVTAIGTQNLIIIAGALMFAASDVVVGQDRFVKYDPRHALLITPLYFGAQAIFAMSVAIV